MMRAPSCCGKVNVKKGNWTPEEDAKMVAYVSKHGTGNWTSLPKKAGLRRCGKSCRLRWTNYLRPDLNHENFTPQEEELIVRLHAAIGSRWSMIAQQLPGRSDNDVKNYWNTKLKKKLTDMGIDPVTHKPFSQILSHYGNIGCIPTKYGSSTLNRDLKHSFIPISKQAISIPKMEPLAQQSNPSLDLLDQLQAIKLVTEASNYRNYDHNTIISDHLFINGASAAAATSSSSSTCSNVAQEKAAMSFSWRDFLLDDAFDDQQQEQANISVGVQDYDEENMIAIGFEISGKLEQNGGKESLDLGINGELEKASNTSFVEALLHKEAEIFCDFPNLLEEPFSY